MIKDTLLQHQEQASGRKLQPLISWSFLQFRRLWVHKGLSQEERTLCKSAWNTLWDTTGSTGHREPPPVSKFHIITNSLELWHPRHHYRACWEVAVEHSHVGKDPWVLWMCWPGTRAGPQPQRPESSRECGGRETKKGQKLVRAWLLLLA